ncbi:site-specific integrase [Bacteroidales bacterium OttesenSCG-928-M11]|nr:site-specific integrase [Bacteroidales bacterium OttesenSCG-928-M11]
MSCTVNILCYKSKTLSNGEHPLMICISKDGKRKYQSLGISVLPQHWDFEKNRPKRNSPNKELIQKFINDKVSEYSAQILEMKVIGKDFTASKLLKSSKNNIIRCTVHELFDKQIKQLEKDGRLKYASTFKELKASMIDYCKDLDIYFSDIDVQWLKGYEAWLKLKGLSLNSIGVRFRTLRVLYNKALDENMVRQDDYPFKVYKVSKLHEETAKRSITKNDIEQIITYKCEGKYKRLSVDLFYFSYLCAGINFKDIAYLTKNNIIDNRLVYYRKKTKKLIKIPIHNEAMNIIKKYEHPNQIYLFPILSSFHQTEIQKANRLSKILRTINKYLKEIGKELELPIDLTTYRARHRVVSFAL